MATSTDAVASVYARSLYELAEQAGGADKVMEVSRELESVCELTRADKRFRDFIASPIIDAKRREASLRRIFANRVTDLTLRFLLLLNSRRRLAQLESISDAFDGMVQEAFGRVEVDVYLPAKPDDIALAAIKERIRAALNAEPVMHLHEDPSMLGGIKLRIGDQLIDASVASSLRRMRRDLLASGGSAIRARLSRFVDDRSPHA